MLFNLLVSIFFIGHKETKLLEYVQVDHQKHVIHQSSRNSESSAIDNDGNIINEF